MWEEARGGKLRKLEEVGGRRRKWEEEGGSGRKEEEVGGRRRKWEEKGGSGGGRTGWEKGGSRR